MCSIREIGFDRSVGGGDLAISARRRGGRAQLRARGARRREASRRRVRAVTSLALFPFEGRWHQVRRCDVRARLLADRHYSRQTPGADEFMSNGRPLVLLTDDERAVWGVLENMSPARGGGLRFRCTIFRNVGAGLSSDLIREATARTYAYWRSHYGGLPTVPLTTEVDPAKTRKKRDPGRCFLRAGWHFVTVDANGLVILQAPDPL